MSKKSGASSAGSSGFMLCMLDTVLRNLIENPTKLTNAGDTIRIKVTPKWKWIDVDAIDTGVGMAQSKVELLFNLGEKTSTVGTNGESGTGLGLQLCKDLLETQGGRLHVESIEGEGSLFRVFLPKPVA